MELDTLVKSRSSMAADIELGISSKFEFKVLELNDEINDLRCELEIMEKRAKTAEQNIMKLNLDIENLRKVSRERIRSETEISQLQELIAVLKRTTTTTTTSNSSSNNNNMENMPMIVDYHNDMYFGTTPTTRTPSKDNLSKQSSSSLDKQAVEKVDMIHLPGGQKALEDLVATALLAANERLVLERERQLREREHERENKYFVSQNIHERFESMSRWGDR